MNKLVFENNSFIYNDSRGKEVLLDGNTEVITKLFGKHRLISKGGREEEAGADYALIDMIVASHLLKCVQSARVLELGAVSGVLSYHLISLMGNIDKESHLCCVGNVIGNSSGNQWLDKIMLTEDAAEFSYLTSDYHDTLLQEGAFDVIVINGIVNFEEPYGVIKEAKRLVKDEGILICYCKDAPLLESSFKLDFEPDRRRIYSLVPEISIITASK